MIDDEDNPLALLDLRVRIVHGLVAALDPTGSPTMSVGDGAERLEEVCVADQAAPWQLHIKGGELGSGAGETRRARDDEDLQTHPPTRAERGRRRAGANRVSAGAAYARCSGSRSRPTCYVTHHVT